MARQRRSPQRLPISMLWSSTLAAAACRSLPAWRSVGSFLNVVAVARAAAALVGRRTLGLHELRDADRRHDNMPLVSYAILRGRCRACGERIPCALPARRSPHGRCSSSPACLRFGVDGRRARRGLLLRRPCRDRCDRPRAAHRPEPDRAAGRCRLARRRRLLLEPGLEWPLAALARLGALPLRPALVYPAGLGMGDVKLALLLGADARGDGRRSR